MLLLRPNVRALALMASIPLAVALATSLGGCGSDLDDVHPNAGRLEIATRGAPPALLAVWTAANGWTDADGEALAELPAPVHLEGEEPSPLRAEGPHASLGIRFFDRDGSAIEMTTLSRDQATGERECSEHSARYYPSDDATDLIAWPPIRHPDSQGGPFQFVELASGDIAGIFHCDHIHIYPENAGTTDLEFVLWHVDHADDFSDPLTIRVEAE
jgi:hypothetical protein